MKNLSKLHKVIIAISVSLIAFSGQAYVSATSYVIQKNDTFWDISKKYKMDLKDIIAANPQFKNPNRIYPGDKVTISSVTNSKPIRGKDGTFTSGVMNNVKPTATPSSFEIQVVELVNKQRTSKGLKALTNNTSLESTARKKSQDMINRGYFSHQSPTYGSPFDMMKRFGIKYSSAGENIAMGQKTPQAVVTAWMNSEGHRRNILSVNYSQIGVGLAKKSNGTTYWTQMFIRP